MKHAVLKTTSTPSHPLFILSETEIWLEQCCTRTPKELSYADTLRFSQNSVALRVQKVRTPPHNLLFRLRL